uniref:T-cell receptor alpha/delta variable 8.0 n=1 Tax=Cyprinus carpio TaxID=7962 RepID=A0A8C1Y7H7_CYPCA
LDKDAKIFSLIIKINIFFFSGNSFANTIQTLYSEKHVVRGTDVILSCNYSGDWYRQYPRSRPEYLIFNTETAVSHESTLRLKAKAKKEITEVELEISSTEVKDSAVYYCALVPTVTGNPPALYKNLIHEHIMHYTNTVTHQLPITHNRSMMQLFLFFQI